MPTVTPPLLPFEAHTRRIFGKFNARRVPRARIELLSRSIEEAVRVAREEALDESLGHFEQTVQRMATGLLRSPDALLLSEWRKPDCGKLIIPKICRRAGVEPWDEDSPVWQAAFTTVLELRLRVADHARRLGAEPARIDAAVLRTALTNISEGKTLPAPTPTVEFMEATGTSPIAKKRRKGGPLPEAGIGDITCALACIYRELTGRKPGVPSCAPPRRHWLTPRLRQSHRCALLRGDFAGNVFVWIQHPLRQGLVLQRRRMDCRLERLAWSEQLFHRCRRRARAVLVGIAEMNRQRCSNDRCDRGEEFEFVFHDDEVSVVPNQNNAQAKRSVPDASWIRPAP